MDADVRRRFQEPDARDLRVALAANVDLVVADDRVRGADIDGHARLRLLRKRRHIEEIARHGGELGREMARIAQAGDVDGTRAVVDEEVVANHDLRRAMTGPNGGAAVARSGLEHVVGDDVLAGAELFEVLRSAADVAHRHGPRVAHVVADELDKPRRASHEQPPTSTIRQASTLVFSASSLLLKAFRPNPPPSTADT